MHIQNMGMEECIQFINNKKNNMKGLIKKLRKAFAIHNTCYKLAADY